MEKTEKITPQMRLLIAVMDNIDMWTDSGDTDYLRKAMAEIRAQIEREEEHE